MDDCDVLRLDVVGNEVAGGRALQAVEADGAEDQLVTAGGDVRAGGSRGDHQDAFVLIDVGRRLSGAGAEVADNELHFVIDDLVGHRHGLLRIAGVVVAYAFQLLAVHPRSEEHTSELQSLMRNSYAVFVLKKKNTVEI